MKALKPGEHFIFADDRTRFLMSFPAEPRSLQVLTVVSVELDSEIVRFKYLNGDTDFLYFNDECKAVLIKHPYNNFRKNVVCENCGKGHGDHYPGIDARTNGIECLRHGSKESFVPNEYSLKSLHPEAYEQEDFFASLGL